MEQNVKIQKLSEVASKIMDHIEELRASFEKSATIVSCLLEFNSIE